MSANQYCGFVAIVGRPNVGKSSLLNALLREKVSITSHQPQTTRHAIQGIKTQDAFQTVYVDTPGMHIGAKKALNRQLNQSARHALMDVNAVIWVVQALHWTEEDAAVCQLLQTVSAPCIIALNKIDRVMDKTALLGFMEMLAERLPSATIIPISAKKRDYIDVLETRIQSYLPESPFYYPAEQTRQSNDRFHCAELIREKLLWSLEQEVPHGASVEIEHVEALDHITHIHALIWVEREGQKAIVVGEKGQQLKEIGIKARQDLERFLGKKLCLKLWVKVKKNWSDDVKALKELGYTH